MDAIPKGAKHRVTHLLKCFRTGYIHGKTFTYLVCIFGGGIPHFTLTATKTIRIAHWNDKRILPGIAYETKTSLEFLYVCWTKLVRSGRKLWYLHRPPGSDWRLWFRKTMFGWRNVEAGISTVTRRRRAINTWWQISWIIILLDDHKSLYQPWVCYIREAPGSHDWIPRCQ